MDTIDRSLQWIFAISLILVLVAYWAGTRGVLNAFFTGFNSLLLTTTGRNAQGQFAAYPSGTGYTG